MCGLLLRGTTTVMIAPLTTRKPARTTSADSLRRFYSRTAEAADPAAQYTALAAAWSELLGEAPIALFCAPRADEYRLMATAGWPDEPPAPGIPLPATTARPVALNEDASAGAVISTMRLVK